MDFSKFNNSVDLSKLKEDINNSGASSFEEVPHGDYEVAVKKLELKESKAGKPMVCAWFKIVAGDRKNAMIFLNQVITTGFQIKIVNDILESLGTNVEISFEDYQQYAALLSEVFDAVEGQFEYALEYGENKGFNTFKIIDRFEV